MKSYLDIVYDENHPNECIADIFTNDSSDTENLFIYFHGGGIEGGTKNDTREFCRYLHSLDVNTSIATCDYRMYPNAHFPDFIEDCASAVSWFINDSNDKVKFKKNKLYIGGSSAGAYLSMMLCFDKRYLGKHGIDSLSDVSGYIFDAGQPTVHFNTLRERGFDTRLVRIDEAAPLYFINEDFEKSIYEIYEISEFSKNSPNFLFFAADNDMENRLEQNLVMMTTMRHFGFPSEKIEYHLMKGFSHCGYTGNQEFSYIIRDFINKQTN